MREFDPYWFNEEESWHDIKVENVVFPSHDNENMDGEVVTYKIDPLLKRGMDKYSEALEKLSD